MVVTSPFINCYLLGVCRTWLQPQATSEAITFEVIKIQTSSASQNDRLNLSFVKDKHTYGKKMARKGPTTVVYQYLSFPIIVYFLLSLVCLVTNIKLFNLQDLDKKVSILQFTVLRIQVAKVNCRKLRYLGRQTQTVTWKIHLAELHQEGQLTISLLTIQSMQFCSAKFVQD